MDQVVGLLGAAVSSPSGKAIASTSVAVAVCMYSFDFLKQISALEFEKSCDQRHDVYSLGFVFVIIVLLVTFIAHCFAWFKKQEFLESKVKDQLVQIGTLTNEVSEEKFKVSTAERERDRDRKRRIEAVAESEAAKQFGQQIRTEKDELAERTGRLTIENERLQASIVNISADVKKEREENKQNKSDNERLNSDNNKLRGENQELRDLKKQLKVKMDEEKDKETKLRQTAQYQAHIERERLEKAEKELGLERAAREQLETERAQAHEEKFFSQYERDELTKQLKRQKRKLAEAEDEHRATDEELDIAMAEREREQLAMENNRLKLEIQRFNRHYFTI